MTARLWVHLTPRGGADRIDGVGPDGELRVRVRAVAADGAANAALCRLLAAELGLARRHVAIERGHTARRKLVVLAGVEDPALAARWPGLGVGVG